MMMMVRLSGEIDWRDCRGPHSARIVAIELQARRGADEGRKTFETMTQCWDSSVRVDDRPSGTATNEERSSLSGALSKRTAGGYEMR
jgi:hypothetical protein